MRTTEIVKEFKIGDVVKVVLEPSHGGTSTDLLVEYEILCEANSAYISDDEDGDLEFEVLATKVVSQVQVDSEGNKTDLDGGWNSLVGTVEPWVRLQHGPWNHTGWPTRVAFVQSEEEQNLAID